MCVCRVPCACVRVSVCNVGGPGCQDEEVRSGFGGGNRDPEASFRGIWVAVRLPPRRLSLGQPRLVPPARQQVTPHATVTRTTETRAFRWTACSRPCTCRLNNWACPYWSSGRSLLTCVVHVYVRIMMRVSALRGLKAVTKYKLGYDPVEISPEDMLPYARERPQVVAKRCGIVHSSH